MTFRRFMVLIENLPEGSAFHLEVARREEEKQRVLDVKEELEKAQRTRLGLGPRPTFPHRSRHG